LAFRVERDAKRPALFHLRFVPEDRRTALTRVALASLGEALATLAKAETARVIALHGAGEETFATGAALDEIEALDAESAAAFADLGRGVIGAWESLEATTVAVVRGVCYGGALDLALGSDLLVAFPKARFAHPGVRRGIVTGWGGTLRARRRLSPAALRSLFIDGEPVEADRALANGLVDFVVESEAELADELARWAGAAGDLLRSLKAVARATEGLTSGQAVVVEERMRELAGPRGPREGERGARPTTGRP
jgi:enoyl-CoA hydratase/carnithine racemase